MARFLICTADERFWKKDCPVLFLGEWCKILSEEDSWKDLDSETVSYHWNDRNRLFQDYQKVDSLYETALISLSNSLNRVHQTQYPLAFWRVVVGPWLFSFTGILYDRFLSLSSVPEVKGCLIPKDSAESLASNDYREFIGSTASDRWNQSLYGEIIRLLGIPYQEIEAGALYPVRSNNRSHKARLKTVLGSFNRSWARNKKGTAFISAYFSPWDLAQLQLQMGQVPVPDCFPAEVKSVAWDASMRKEVKLGMGESDFERLLEKLISRWLPKVYLEGFKTSLAQGKEIFPGYPEGVVTTASRVLEDDVFKLWAAEKKQAGTSLYLSQHGGHYGTGKWSSEEAHEIKVADRFITWGWSEGKKSLALPSAKLQKTRGLRPDPKGDILLVSNSFFRYFYRFFSAPMASQALDFLEDQMEFVRELSPEIQSLLRVRLYPHEYGWNERLRWQRELPHIQMAPHSQSMLEQLKESRLFVGTHNTTTFLEALAADFPTVVFWNPNHWELRESAECAFEELEEVGIFHRSPESAARQVEKIAASVGDWWKGDRLQKVRRSYCNRFARVESQWKRVWSDALLAERHPRTLSPSLTNEMH